MAWSDPIYMNSCVPAVTVCEEMLTWVRLLVALESEKNSISNSTELASRRSFRKVSIHSRLVKLIFGWAGFRQLIDNHRCHSVSQRHSLASTNDNPKFDLALDLTWCHESFDDEFFHVSCRSVDRNITRTRCCCYIRQLQRACITELHGRWITRIFIQLIFLHWTSCSIITTSTCEQRSIDSCWNNISTIKSIFCPL